MYLYVFDSLLDQHFHGLPFYGQTSKSTQREMIRENDKGFGLLLQTPEFSMEDLKINVKNHILEIKGETKNDWGEKISWEKKFKLDPRFDSTLIKAQMDKGTLKIFIPKLEKTITTHIVPILDNNSENIFNDLLTIEKESA